MIAQSFSYHRPASWDEAAILYAEEAKTGGTPMYYGGGTEILTRARLGEVAPSAVIDLKGIPETRELSRRRGNLVLGAALTLAELSDSGWSLLAQASGRVADHTTRRQITLGGNLAGTVFYRESALPFLLVPTTAIVAGRNGTRRVDLAKVFEEGILTLNDGEFLMALEVPLDRLPERSIAIKRTRLDWVDYPLVTVALAEKDGEWIVALSGYLDRPFRAHAVERSLNDGMGTLADRIRRGVEGLPEPLSDVHGSAAYRRFVLGWALEDALNVI